MTTPEKAQTVWKYQLGPGETLHIDWPTAARVLRAECEHGGDLVWFWVARPVHAKTPPIRTFQIVATGQPFRGDWTVEATATDLGYSNLVWHLVSHG